ncbi:MAG: response regulator transcription factor [Sphingobacteriales bacterium]
MLSLNNTGATKFSDREIQVLKLIIGGKTNPQIAGELNISPLTVKTHRQNLLRKLNAENTAQMIANAGLKGLL